MNVIAELLKSDLVKIFGYPSLIIFGFCVIILKNYWSKKDIKIKINEAKEENRRDVQELKNDMEKREKDMEIQKLMLEKNMMRYITRDEFEKANNKLEKNISTHIEDKVNSLKEIILALLGKGDKK